MEPSLDAKKNGTTRRQKAKTHLRTVRLNLPPWMISKNIEDATAASHRPRVKLHTRLTDRMPIPASTHFLCLVTPSVDSKATKAIGAFMLIVLATSKPCWFR